MSVQTFEIKPVGMRNGFVMSASSDSARVSVMVWDTPERALEMTMEPEETKRFIEWLLGVWR